MSPGSQAFRLERTKAYRTENFLSETEGEINLVPGEVSGTGWPDLHNSKTIPKTILA
jgi:hypothetical protein